MFDKETHTFKLKSVTIKADPYDIQPRVMSAKRYI